MRLIYLSHPIAARGVHAVRDHVLLARSYLGAIERELLRRHLDWYPLAPYIAALAALGYRETPAARDRGLAADCELVARCDALALLGRTVTEGMQAELEAAERAGLPVHDITGLPPLVAADALADALEGVRYVEHQDAPGDASRDAMGGDSGAMGGCAAPACQAVHDESPRAPASDGEDSRW